MTERGHGAGLGDFIRRQREMTDLSMRRLASMVGISGPYLSQIERGLRAPSEAVLQAIADSLDVSVDALREHLDATRGEDTDTETLAALRRDRNLTAAQRQAMIEVYQAFLEVNAGRRAE